MVTRMRTKEVEIEEVVCDVCDSVITDKYPNRCYICRRHVCKNCRKFVELSEDEIVCEECLAAGESHLAVIRKAEEEADKVYEEELEKW